MTMQELWQMLSGWVSDYMDLVLDQVEMNFMLVNTELLEADSLPKEVNYFYLASFLVLILFSILASDSFKLMHPIEGIKEWKTKLSFVKVLVFSAAVYSVHTFYKLLVAMAGNVLHAAASVSALPCLGAYINPLSLVIYGFAISTLTLRKKRIQAVFLGWATFLTPAAMSYYTFSAEHVAIYVTAAVIGLVGGILYGKCTPYITCFVLYLVYFAAKFFMLDYSDEVLLLSEETWTGKLGQYLACVEMDLILSFLILLVVFGYCCFTDRYLYPRKAIAPMILLGMLTAVSIVCSNIVQVDAVTLEREDILDEWLAAEEEDSLAETGEEMTQEETQSQEEAEPLETQVVLCVSVEVANIRSGPGTEYDVITTAMNGEEYTATGNEESADNGRVWYEIYLDGEMNETGWISEAVADRIEKISMSALAGFWLGEYDSELTLYEDGTCHYVDGGVKEGEGTWSVDTLSCLHINTDALSYELYAQLEEGNNTTVLLMEADSSNWRDEEFFKQ